MFTGPACGGVLLQVMNPGLPRFRCHAGHAYSVASLLSALPSGATPGLTGPSVRLRTADRLPQVLQPLQLRPTFFQGLPHLRALYFEAMQHGLERSRCPLQLIDEMAGRGLAGKAWHLRDSEDTI